MALKIGPTKELSHDATILFARLAWHRKDQALRLEHQKLIVPRWNN